MELLLSVALGIGLSAACGFRIFVPFTIMSIAALSGTLHFSSDFAWIGTYPALVVFVTASMLEILAYYIPWLDNLLDALATPAAMIAGTIATASVVTGMSPLLQWTTAIIAGGVAAGAVQTSTTLLRGASSVTTGGLGNFLVATVELIGSIMTSLLALVMPWLVFLLTLLLGIWFIRKVTQRASNIRQTA